MNDGLAHIVINTLVFLPALGPFAKLVTRLLDSPAMGIAQSQDEVTEFLTHILSGNITTDLVEVAKEQLRMADEYLALLGQESVTPRATLIYTDMLNIAETLAGET